MPNPFISAKYEEIFQNCRKYTAWDPEVHRLIVNAIGPEDDPDDGVIEEVALALSHEKFLYDSTVQHGSREICRELMLGRIDLTDVEELSKTYLRREAKTRLREVA